MAEEMQQDGMSQQFEANGNGEAAVDEHKMNTDEEMRKMTEKYLLEDLVGKPQQRTSRSISRNSEKSKTHTSKQILRPESQEVLVLLYLHHQIQLIRF